MSYVYFEEKSGHLSAAKLLSKDEARRIAANIAYLGDGKIEGGHQSGAMFAAWRPFCPAGHKV